MTHIHLKELLVALGFSPKNGEEENVYSKSYGQHNGYEIIVNLMTDLKHCNIDWGGKIRVVRKTSSDFSKAESFVVLECVDRLLERGYKPDKLVLEQQWKLGHAGKGFLDIQVLDSYGTSFLMVECKTWGSEYDKAKKDTIRDGGQIFSYYIQEKNTQYLALYASILEGGKVCYQSDIIVVNSVIRNAENQKEAFEAWHPQIFESKGIFNSDEPYLVRFEGLLKSDLKELTAKDGGDIFHRFAEILRKNVVSDKTNAFNKIFNLFLCKIVDEFETAEDEELKFQWKENESNEAVMIRMNDLYKRGMELYLNLRIESVSEEELQKELNKAGGNKESLRQLFIRQKLYSGNEFAFKEVFDKKTFEENCIAVKEVVKLLEKYKIKYSTKQQFLGDFFENLLSTGIKQESGQFFTPIPIAQFICKSLPIQEMIEQKNDRKEPHFLPYIIDFASGSGHFLTEVMDEVDRIIRPIDSRWMKCGEKHRDEFLSKKEKFRWAEEYIYGIEKDYRLAKTTKISTFLNGDGDANVICGDGLDSFNMSSEYRGLLDHVENGMENRQFDIIVANPPYSVDGFKTTLPHGKDSFVLYPALTDNSSEIECLFVERTKQLLKTGGVAGIILPISILTNEGIQTKTRELLLKYFEIKAIIELGSNTFMATSQKTATLFLKRRDNDGFLAVNTSIKRFFDDFKDVTCNGITRAYSTYLTEVHDGMSLQQYQGFFNGTEDLSAESDVFLGYMELFRKLPPNEYIAEIKKIEAEKLLYFFLSYGQRIVLVKAPDEVRAEKDFLGYEFSSAKGREGIKIYRDKYDDNRITTKLYAEGGELDNKKVNFYIHKSFNNEIDDIQIEPSLEKVVRIERLFSLLDFKNTTFQKKIISSKKVIFHGDYSTEKLINRYPVVDSGSTAPQDRELFRNGTHPFIRAGNISSKDEDNCVVPAKDSMLNDRAVSECKLKMFKSGAIVFAKSGRSAMTNNIARLKADSYVVNHLACIYSDNKLDLDFLYYLLEYYQTSNFVSLDSDYPSVNLADIRNFAIPIVDDSVKKLIVTEMKKIEKGVVKNMNQEKHKVMSTYFSKVRV